MQRRQFLGGAALAAACFSSYANAQIRRPVRLIILRRLVPIPASNCTTRCIRGRIYDVSDLGAGALETAVVPLLAMRQPICDTIERPWRNNLPSRSSIPAGTYPATIRTDPSKDWMNTLDRRWRLELGDVPHRTNIQFHYGEDVSWSEGCFILGSLLSANGQLADSSYCKLENGEQAVAALRAVVTAPGNDPRDIQIGIADAAGLFPNYSPTGTCP